MNEIKKFIHVEQIQRHFVSWNLIAKELKIIMGAKNEQMDLIPV